MAKTTGYMDAKADDGDGRRKAYCLSPIHPSEMTMELPGLWGSYFTEVGRPRRQECRLIH